MASESSSASELELGHVLFMDIVDYSKLLVDEQSDITRQLNQIVRDTDQVRRAEEKGKLIRLPTGDGMALVFFTSPEAPMLCALEISRGSSNTLRSNYGWGFIADRSTLFLMSINERMSPASELTSPNG